MSTEANLPGHITYRITNFILKWAHRQWGTSSPPMMEAWEQEVNQIEQILVNEATHPNQVSRKTKVSEPLTEQQRIIDLAG